MATSPSPQLSPSAGVALRNERTRSDTPPAQPISKRDKRRTQLLDRLQEVTTQFSSNKDQYYRQQLQGLQLDTGLILHSNIYSDNPENEMSDAVEPFVYKVTGGDNSALAAVREKKIDQIAGKIWSGFIHDIHETVENRDAALTTLKKELDYKLAQYSTAKVFMTKLADEEHRALGNTLRDRLINSVTGRKARLNKDKDVEAISESNALLMHPNQYTMANPSSPGGVLGKRATRHRRDVDDLSSMIDGHKRKRRAVDDSGSPVPSRRLLENGFSTPIWTSEQVANAATKGNSPLYSIDKLFTEKELAMTYNQAAMAAQHFIVTHKTRDYGDGSSPEGDESNDADADLADLYGDVDGEGPETPPEAPAMERQVSHATRSTRGQLGSNSLTGSNGVEAINFNDLLLPGTFSRMSSQMPKMPPLMSTIASKPYLKETANSPSGVTSEDLNQDLQRIERCKAVNEEMGGGRSLDMPNGDRDLLEAAVAHPGQFPVWLSGADKKPRSALGRGKRQIQAQYSNLRAEDILGGFPMSKQSSMGGSEMGGVPMSRTGTGDGSRRRGVRGA